MTAPFPATTKPLQSMQEELDADTEGSTSIIDTIRRPFLGTRRGRNATQKEAHERNSMERRQKTPPRTWLQRVATRLTISRGNKGTIKSNTGEKGEGTEETSRRAGFKRKPIPSFAPRLNDRNNEDKDDDIPSLSQYSSSHEGGTQTSTQRPSASIRTPRSTEDHSAGATNDQVWDFDEEVEISCGESKGESNTVSHLFYWEYDPDSMKHKSPRSRGTPSRPSCRTVHNRPVDCVPFEITARSVAPVDRVVHLFLFGMLYQWVLNKPTSTVLRLPHWI